MASYTILEKNFGSNSYVAVQATLMFRDCVCWGVYACVSTGVCRSHKKGVRCHETIGTGTSCRLLSVGAGTPDHWMSRKCP